MQKMQKKNRALHSVANSVVFFAQLFFTQKLQKKNARFFFSKKNRSQKILQ